jgi:hypothetical protein
VVGPHQGAVQAAGPNLTVTLLQHDSDQTLHQPLRLPGTPLGSGSAGQRRHCRSRTNTPAGVCTNRRHEWHWCRLEDSGFSPSDRIRGEARAQPRVALDPNRTGAAGGPRAARAGAGATGRNSGDDCAPHSAAATPRRPGLRRGLRASATRGTQHPRMRRDAARPEPVLRPHAGHPAAPRRRRRSPGCVTPRRAAEDLEIPAQRARGGPPRHR